ncbi:MAG TPA: hypothetical protein VEC15_10735 [Actinomycetota bacterium]|nr:hypothetical protein [Actinomycetota bacterium]
MTPSPARRAVLVATLLGFVTCVVVTASTLVDHDRRPRSTASVFEAVPPTWSAVARPRGSHDPGSPELGTASVESAPAIAVPSHVTLWSETPAEGATVPISFEISQRAPPA